MRVPLSWIRDFAPVEGDVATLAGTLDDLGLVVEGVRRVGEGLERVVVARVEEIAAIAGADRIRAGVVDAGDGPVEVVCGAWNFAVGDLVPLAPVGAVLPGGFEIGRRKMKGVVSNGMLCSPRELELSEDHEGILVLGGAGTPAPGTPLMAALGLEPDVVFDVAVETNRPDAACVAGVARDLAAACKVPFGLPEAPEPPAGPVPVTELTTVVVADDDLCPRFVARVLTGVTVGESPAWVQRRLTLAGMRPVNSVVDASNYVMLELGQPTHPYDLDRVGGGGLRVRAARPGERVVTLDGKERVLGARSIGAGDDLRDCLICDATDTAIGIAGIMGGASTEISAGTRRVLLEAAYFSPMAVARTSKRLALRTEASARFERGCDPEGIDRSVRRLVELLAGVEVAAGQIDVRGPVPGPRPVAVRTARVNALLGTALSEAEIAGLLEPIGFAVRPSAGGVLDVTVPTFRPDTEREVDVIEEVARHHGYSRIARRTPRPAQVGEIDAYQRERRQVRDVLAGLGADEAWTASLLAPGDHERAGWPADGIRVANPLVPDQSVLRMSILPGMLAALAANAGRRQGEVRLFEVGHVFPPPEKARVDRALAAHQEWVVDEREMAAVALRAPGDDAMAASGAWYALADAMGITGVEVVADAEAAPAPAAGAGLHPARRGWLVHEEVQFGVVGEVDPDVLESFGLDPGAQRVGWLELDLGLLLGTAPRRSELAEAASRFPSSDLDLAFVVAEEVPAAAVRATLAAAGGGLLERVRLFDVYRGPGLPPGTRSLAFRLRFCALDHTLEEAELHELRARCVAAVGAAHGAELRG
ncbi:MAG: phenylalanine--tRNA ligase subunit beta [Acidobacteriota bacterium]|nr:phenylalanine--tRNA ligase subunit beta [Acidobacteriota bacterium]